MPFGDKVTMQSFDNRVRTDYASALSLMCGFSEDFIDFGSSTRKDYWLVKALLELLDEDDSIDGEQEIYAREDGVATTKSAILAASTFCLQPLLLGLWHFVLLNRADNRVGKDTYDLWCPATGGSERAYTYTLGETITRTICITYSTQSHPTVDTEIIDEDIVEDAGPEAQAKAAPNTSPAQSVVNNNPTFFTFNVTGNNNSFINKVDTIIIENGGRKDE